MYVRRRLKDTNYRTIARWDQGPLGPWTCCTWGVDHFFFWRDFGLSHFVQLGGTRNSPQGDQGPWDPRTCGLPIKIKLKGHCMVGVVLIEFAIWFVFFFVMRVFQFLIGLNMEDLATVGSGAMGLMNLRFARQAQTEGHDLKDHCTVGPGAPGPMDL